MCGFVLVLSALLARQAIVDCAAPQTSSIMQGSVWIQWVLHDIPVIFVGKMAWRLAICWLGKSYWCVTAVSWCWKRWSLLGYSEFWLCQFVCLRQVSLDCSAVWRLCLCWLACLIASNELQIPALITSQWCCGTKYCSLQLHCCSVLQKRSMMMENAGLQWVLQAMWHVCRNQATIGAFIANALMTFWLLQCTAPKVNVEGTCQYSVSLACHLHGMALGRQDTTCVSLELYAVCNTCSDLYLCCSALLVRQTIVLCAAPQTRSMMTASVYMRWVLHAIPALSSS